MKTKRIVSLLVSVIMAVGTVTAVPFTASAVETNAPVVSAQSAKTSLATPKITKAESVNNGVKISWERVNGATRYRVYYKGSKGWTRLADTTSTAYTDKAVSSGKNYTYTVRCLSADAKRFTSGYDSKGKSVKFLSVPKITKTENVYGGVKLTWNKVSGAEKYRVYYKKNNEWKGLGNTTSTSFNDTKAMSDHNYTYTVRCITKDGRNFASGYDGKGKSILYTASPQILNAGVAYGGIRIEWKEVIGAEKYRVYVKNGKNWKRLADTTSTEFTDKTAGSKGTYTYTVRCINPSENTFMSGFDSKGITVNAADKPYIMLDKVNLSIYKGKSYTLKKIISDRTKNAVWSSSNTKVASVDKNGKITAKSKGVATITAKVNGYSATCKVTVIQPIKVDKIISTAKSLVGKDSGKGCDIMKWYGNYDTTINAVACCCAGQMYLFNKAGALDMIPGGKTTSCGVVAVNFLEAGQLYSANNVKPGDLVIFSWSGKPTKYDSRLKAKGCKSLDHIELCIAVDDYTITTVGANNGGTECDNFRIRTRYKSNISCCCRPKYAK